MAPVIATPVATSITATPVAPQTTLPTNAMGSPPHLTEQLIKDLVHGCSIGYHGPQFPATAKHLSSALQHTSIIDESLKKETETGRIL